MTSNTAVVAPHNLEAEQALLGACLLRGELVDDALEHVTATGGDFYAPNHGHIWHALVEAWNNGDGTDPIAVADHLRRTGILDQAGGLTALIDLQTRCPAASSAPRYARIVAEHSLLRRLAHVGREITDLACGLPEDIPLAVDQAETLLDAAVRRGRTVGQATWLADTMADHAEQLEHRRTHQGPIGTPTGIAGLDHLTLGLQAGQLATLGARPAVGKSSLALQITLNAAANGHPVLYVSAEMSRSEIHDRLIACHSRVDLTDLRKGTIAPRDWERVDTGMWWLAEQPIAIVDDPGTGILGVRANARRAARRHGQLGLIVVDYLQLLEPGGRRRDNRQVEVADLSRGLKRLALELAVPILALSQLNRDLETRNDKRPKLADLRESGALEQDSDLVIFIHRDEVHTGNDTKRPGEADLIVAKQRNGPTGETICHYQARYGTWTHMEKII